MIAIITGDVIGSRSVNSAQWITDLKKMLKTQGSAPSKWEIFRGDEFQVEVADAKDALLFAIRLKALFKTFRLDVRLSIGIGGMDYDAAKISESNGTAFVRSGETFESLRKQKRTLAINTGSTADDGLNLMCKLALTFMDHWTVQSAALVLAAIGNAGMSQEELGHKLGIAQAAVSRRRKRAQFDLVLEFDQYFRNAITDAK